MKKILIVGFIMIAGLFTANAQCSKNPTGCTSKEKAKAGCTDKHQKVTEVMVYYFHATRRCATCEAVESVTIEALKEMYGDKVAFKSINREENKDNSMVKKHKISGQTLLIVKGDQVVDLTNEAFMYARTKPDKLKLKIKEAIEPLI